MRRCRSSRMCMVGWGLMEVMECSSSRECMEEWEWEWVMEVVMDSSRTSKMDSFKLGVSEREMKL